MTTIAPDGPRLLRVHVVLNERAGLVHGITTDQETAERWVREIIDQYGRGAARQVADAVEVPPDADLLAEVSRLRAELAATQSAAIEGTVTA